MPQLIAAIDQGTTSTRCILFNRDGPVASSQKEHRQIYPQPGWVEHDPLEIWANTQDVVADALRSGNAQPGDIAAVGITNQRETIVAWDRNTGRPYANAIVWQDTRTREICDSLAAQSDLGIDRFRDLTGLPLATYFSAPKIRWLLENSPDFRAAAHANPTSAAVGTIDSFLVWHLTGGQLVTDATNASRTMLMDLRTLQWDDSLLAAFGIPRSILPRIFSSSDGSIGLTRPDGPFKAAIPISGILGDQQAALVGQACFEPGQSKSTYGTGCFLLLNTGPKLIHSKAGLLTTVAYRFAGQSPVYALEGSIAVTGALVQWFRDNLGLVASSSEIESLAASVPDNGDVYIVPAFSGLFAPYWRSDARGVIVGLTRHSNKAHLARAVLEATAFQVRDVVQAMQADSGTTLGSLKVDGGMAVNELLMQFQADILGVDVIRPRITETTALGAAFAAGLAIGFWPSLADLKSHCAESRRWYPRMAASARASLCACWKKAIDRSLNWL